MGNLVRAQWFRLLHGSSSGPFALTLVAVAGFVVVQFTAYWDDCGTFRAVLGRASVVEVYCVFVALYLAAFFAEDFQYGTVRNLMVGKGSRRAWALSALVVTFGCALGAMLLGAVVTGVVYGLMGGAPVAFDIGELAAWWLVASLLATAFSVGGGALGASDDGRCRSDAADFRVGVLVLPGSGGRSAGTAGLFRD